MSDNGRKVAMSNYLLRSSFHMTAWEKRIIMLAASQIEQGDVIEPGQEFVVAAADMVDLFDSPPANVYRSLARAVSKLMARVISVTFTPDGAPEVTRQRDFHWVEEVTYAKDLNAISLVWSRRVIPYISDLSNQFNKLAVARTWNLNGVWAHKIVDLITSHRPQGRCEFTVAEIAQMLRVPESYRKSTNLLKFQLLLPAVSEIQEKIPELSLVMSQRKVGRRITHFQFSFSPATLTEDGRAAGILEQAERDPDGDAHLQTDAFEPPNQKQKNRRDGPETPSEKSARKQKLRAKLRDIGDLDW